MLYLLLQCPVKVSQFAARCYRSTFLLITVSENSLHEQKLKAKNDEIFTYSNNHSKIDIQLFHIGSFDRLANCAQ